MLFRLMICRLVDESLQMTKNVCIAISVNSCRYYELYYIHNGQIETVTIENFKENIFKL